VKRSY